jgi:hypothetical protein
MNETATSATLDLETASDALIRKWVEAAAQSQLDQEHLAALRTLALQPAASEELLLLMCDRGVCLVELGHRTGPKQLLEKLAEQHKIAEAILTLAKDRYTNASESTDSLQTFLNQHHDNRWMLESLMHQEASSAEKEAAYLEILQQHPSLLDRFISLRKSREQAAQASVSSDPAVLSRIQGDQDPLVLRALATNPHTPDEILLELSKKKNGKHARTIRSFAKETLRKKQR